VGIVVCLQLWMIANALILAWALWPAKPEAPGPLYWPVSRSMMTVPDR
jgi:hypothetical protein